VEKKAKKKKKKKKKKRICIVATTPPQPGDHYCLMTRGSVKSSDRVLDDQGFKMFLINLLEKASNLFGK
jgi:hypothetical protein